MKAKEDRSYYRGDRCDVFALVPQGVRRVLEIGCGAGRFRENFPPCVEYWGVEPVVEAAREAVGLTQVLVGTLDEVAPSLPDGYFDLVVCNDVIEHIVDTRQTMATIRAKMTDEGRLVGSLPNVRSVWVLLELFFLRDWRYRESGVLDNTHVRFFTFRSARRILVENGFEIEVFRGRALGDIWWAKALLVLVSPILCCLGWDICRTQMLFRVRKGRRVDVCKNVAKMVE